VDLEDVGFEIEGLDGTLTLSDGDISTMRAHFQASGYDCFYPYSLPPLGGNVATLATPNESCSIGEGDSMTLTLTEGTLVLQGGGQDLIQESVGTLDLFGAECSYTYDATLRPGTNN